MALLASLRVLTPLRNRVVRLFPDPLKTSDHIRDLVRKSAGLHLTFAHATNDVTIPPSQTDELSPQPWRLCWITDCPDRKSIK